jgi:hypothetical protein
MNGMVTWEPDKLPHDLLKQLLDIMRVPEDRREAAVLSLRCLFTVARKHHRFDLDKSKREAVSAELVVLAKKAAAFRSELSKLSDAAKEWLGVQAYCRELYGEATNDDARRLHLNDLMLMGGVDEGRIQYERFCKVIENIRAAAGEEYWPRNRKGGAPSKSINGPKWTALDVFVSWLYLGENESNWYVTVDPDSGTGSLVKILKLAEPYLPPGLIPPELWTPDSKGRFKGLKRLARHRALVGQTKRPKQRVARTGQKPQKK